MNEEMIIKFIDLLNFYGPLIGVVVGSILSWFGMQSIEKSKWRRERKEKYTELQRDALSVALEWITPMRNSEYSTSSKLMAVIRGDIEVEQFYNEICIIRQNLGDKLLNQELQAKHHAVIPKYIYPHAIEILQMIEEARVIGVKYGQKVKHNNKQMIGYPECSKLLDEINKAINGLEDNLRKEFKKTFI